ncbi:MAG: triosephosphate isomerase (TIM) [Parcubacteria group bacterium Gr01-1014_70]|nr:MAG: triosephosphate isomerase (TIM) [Parcubacteria group bacterium Gr01-1014_70]
MKLTKIKRERKIIVANWKCNPVTLKEARRLFEAAEASCDNKHAEVVVAPPFVYLAEGRRLLKRARLASQDVFWEETGSYTGEVGPKMLRELGSSYVIVGHSERREHFGETNEIVQKKVTAALGRGLRVILCVGERSREGEASTYTGFVKEEVASALRGVPKKHFGRVVIAYEPLWAIGSGNPDTPKSTLEMAVYIRRVVYDVFHYANAHLLPVLYGGSVNSQNAKEFLEEGGVDGVLVGRASLDTKTFSRIVASIK